MPPIILIGETIMEDNKEIKVEEHVIDNKKNKNSWKKGAIIFAIILVVVVLFAVACQGSKVFKKNTSENKGNANLSFSHDYIGKLDVEGTIAEGSEGFLAGENLYNHRWTLSAIDSMIEDSHNKAIILYVNSPGGSVSASDDLYYKLEEYKDKTKRPVFAYFSNMAASGGYYISAGSSKIIANRNCWTGSIGVTIGSIYDATELMSNLGIRAVNITSGRNKAMGSPTAKLTDEQIGIFQGLVDEAYEQFVGIVAEGRQMEIEKVKALADGRVYTAKQAKDLGLVDEIMDMNNAEKYIENSLSSPGIKIEDLKPERRDSLFSILSSKTDVSASENLLREAKAFIESQGKFRVTYISPIEK